MESEATTHAQTDAAPSAAATHETSIATIVLFVFFVAFALLTNPTHRGVDRRGVRRRASPRS